MLPKYTNMCNSNKIIPRFWSYGAFQTTEDRRRSTYQKNNFYLREPQNGYIRK